MLTYVVSHENQKYVMQAVEELGRQVVNAVTANEFDYCAFMRQEAAQLGLIQELVVDADLAGAREDEFMQALVDFKMLYDARLIILAIGREPGDGLLDRIFSNGIYDIVTSVTNPADEIKKCLSEGYSYRDSIRFKTDGTAENKKSGKNAVRTVVKEKVVVKDRILKEACKVTVGFCGAQRRIGTTHMALNAASRLRANGFQVAAIEAAEKEESDFMAIADAYGCEVTDTGCFTLDGIDFYPKKTPQDIPGVMSAKYNFFVIDFGCFRDGMSGELLRCTLPVVAAGAKPWEVAALNGVFSRLEETALKELCYIFQFVPEDNRPDILENMAPLEQVYFSGYAPDPFGKEPQEALQELLKDYMPQEKAREKKRLNLKRIGGLLNHENRKKNKPE